MPSSWSRLSRGRGCHDHRPRTLSVGRRDPVHARDFGHLSQPQERHRHPDVDRAHSARRQHQSGGVLELFGRHRRPGLCADRAHGGGGGSRHRACHPGRLFPQPRLDRGRRHRFAEGVRTSGMYETIVALPLLGSIIAGVIALAGARNRFPGEDPPPPHDDHAAPLVAEDRPRGAPSPHEPHAVLANSHVEEHAAAPPAAGSAPAELITTTLLGIACLLSWYAFYDVGIAGHEARIRLFSYITFADLHSDWALRVDPLTVVMLVVVTTVSSLVHLYSIGYMADDPYKPRFFCYLSFFTFAMLMLVTADNLVQLFFGWEGVGLASYLLIGFWYHKPEANAAAIKAFVVNRIGDFGFSLGIFAVFALTGAVDFDTIFAQAPALAGKSFHFLSWNVDALTTVCLLLR